MGVVNCFNSVGSVDCVSSNGSVAQTRSQQLQLGTVQCERAHATAPGGRVGARLRE